MAELEAMILQVNVWKEFHRGQHRRGVAGALIEAAACAIRETALWDAREAILREAKAGRI